jgi:hypothetical protein
VTDSDRLDKIIELLAAVAKQLGARVPRGSSPPTDEELSAWREANRRLPRGGESDFPTSTTTRERFWSREGR